MKPFRTLLLAGTVISGITSIGAIAAEAPAPGALLLAQAPAVPPGEVPPEEQKSVLASSFSASLELAKDGQLELRQEKPFAPLYLRANAGGA